MNHAQKPGNASIWPRDRALRVADIARGLLPSYVGETDDATAARKSWSRAEALYALKEEKMRQANAEGGLLPGEQPAPAENDEALSALRRGAEFPFHKVAESAPASPTDWCERAALGILWDLGDRRGIKDQLARFKHPRQLILLDELPRNTMGKVQKNILREAYKDMFAG